MAITLADVRGKTYSDNEAFWSDLEDVVETARAQERELCTQLLDEDGYPTEAALRRISHWPVRSMMDCRHLLQFARTLWRYPDRFCEIEPGGELGANWYLSTAGWGGNEDVIGAMEGNVVFWSFTWVQSRRGGHYWFRETGK